MNNITENESKPMLKTELSKSYKCPECRRELEINHDSTESPLAIIGCWNWCGWHMVIDMPSSLLKLLKLLEVVEHVDDRRLVVGSG